MPLRKTAIVTKVPVSALAVSEISCKGETNWAIFYVIQLFISSPFHINQKFYLKLGLFDANVVVAVQPLAAEVLGPVGVLVVEHQQREASVLVESGTRGARDGRS